MKQLFRIRLGGVPEHFNLPLQLAIKNGDFAAAGLDVQWQTFKGGTGEMTKALAENTCDVCLVLTEGIISAILQGNPSKIVSGYVTTPLVWGIHTASQNTTLREADIFSKQIAISRKGSGSHLMPLVHALQQEQQLADRQFNIIENLEGALKSLEAGETEVFYWEKATTAPYVQSGQLRRIGQFVSPWPCFVVAATEKMIEQAPQQLDTLLQVMQQACEQFMHNADAVQLVVQHHQLAKADAEQWFHATEWATNSWVSDKMLKSVVFTLKQAGILPEGAEQRELVWVR